MCPTRNDPPSVELCDAAIGGKSMKTSFFCATAVAALSMSGQLTAHAQTADHEDARRLDVVTVTTQKQTQSLIDVPINISVTDQSTIDKLGADDIEDLANFIPGLWPAPQG